MTRDWFPLILAAAVFGYTALSIACAAIYDLIARTVRHRTARHTLEADIRQAIRVACPRCTPVSPCIIHDDAFWTEMDRRVKQ